MSRPPNQPGAAGGLDGPGDTVGRLWPVNLVIALLAGSTLGAVVATADFADPRGLWERRDWLGLAANGWGQVSLVAGLLAVLIGSAVLLRRAAVRRVQLCVVLSLLFHFWLAVYLHTQHLPLPFASRDHGLLAVDEPEPEVAPDYHWEQIDTPDRVQAFERPVESKSPEPGDDLRVARRKPDQPTPIERLVPVEPDEFHRRLPDPASLQRAELPAPRREELAAGGQVSRQELKQTLEPGEPIPMPQIRPGGPPVPVQPSAQTAAAQRDDSALPELSRSAAASPPDPRRWPDRVSMARQTEEALPAVDPSDVRPAVRSRATDLPDTAAEAPEIARAEAAGIAGVEARSTAAGRRAEAPRVAGSVAEPETTGRPLVARAAAAPRRADAEPEIEATAGTVPMRRLWSPDTAPVIEQPPIEGPGLSGAPGAAAGSVAGVAMRAAPTDVGRRSTGLGSVAPAASGPAAVAAGPGGAGVALGPRAAASRLADGGGGVVGGSPGGLARAAARPDLPGGAVRGHDAPAASGNAARPSGMVDVSSLGPGPLDAAMGSGVTGPNQRLGGLQVEIAAPPGPGGLSRDPTPVVGLPSRRARPEAEVVHDAPERFVLSRSGGTLAMDARIREVPKPAFQGRDPNRRGARARAFGGTEATEQAVERGIDFLARHQFPAGNWALDRSPHDRLPGYDDAAWGAMNADTAATGLALLAFLGAGYTHMDGKHEAAVRRGVEWLLRNQQPDGRLFTPETDRTRFAQFYGHAMAAIALCEAYGMTGDRNLREPTQRAIGFILATQHPTLGGWRYAPQLESDTSVSGWMLMALKSAQMAGLEVPADALAKVSQWLDTAQAGDGSRYRYNPYAADTPEQREGRRPNLAMTAEGLLMRMYLGWQQNNRALVEGASVLQANLPREGTQDEPARDSYYWYYATQVMFQMQGDYWTAWNRRLAPTLEKSQTLGGPLAGSWHPSRPVPDRWGKDGGRHYVTTLNLLMLEVTYRHLPLYRELAK